MAPVLTYNQTTQSVHVSVLPTYLESQSCADENTFVWAYHIIIYTLPWYCLLPHFKGDAHTSFTFSFTLEI